MSGDAWAFTGLPTLGVGLGYRDEFEYHISQYSAEIDWLEITVENYLPLTYLRRQQLEALGSTFPCIPHGVDLSLASQGRESAKQLDAYVEFVNFLHPPWCSDHLALTQVNGVNFGQLIPPRRDLATASRVADRIKQIQDRTQVPFILENIASTTDSGGSLDPGAFIDEICELAGCGLLVDLANLYADDVNLGHSAEAFFASIDPRRVVQVHIAGGRWQDGWLRDTHDQPVSDAVWDLLRDLASRAQIKGVLLERDSNFPSDFSEMLSEIRSARAILEESACVAGSRPTLTPTAVLTRGAVSGRALDQPDGDDTLLAKRTLAEAQAKRWAALSTWFPATVRALNLVHTQEVLAAMPADLAAEYPRFVAEDDAMGVRQAELSRYRRFLLMRCETNAVLRSLTEFEACLVELQLGFSEPHAAQAAIASCAQCGNAEGISVDCDEAHIALRQSVRRLDLPSDIVSIRERVMAGMPTDIANDVQKSNLVIVLSEEGAVDIYRLNEWQADIIAIAASSPGVRNVAAACPDVSTAQRRLDFLVARGIVEVTHPVKARQT
jgi:uncharacterized protein (UPF0276 family)